MVTDIVVKIDADVPTDLQYFAKFPLKRHYNTDGLFNGLLCKAVSTSATFVFIVNALPDLFLSVTDPVSRNRCTKSVIIDAFAAVSPGYFC
ncbi:uncharacterized protein TNCV_2033471 [Trichonephila clavipes]|nr:uncharacterized protein TNCV_2033471 [Trichonephila clavipes]